ncbi:hypothetical protein ACOMHN_007158 [Nucella lapillus]
MHQNDDQDQDQSENWLAPFELECVDQLQSEPNLEEKLLNERDLTEKQLFLLFQNSASAISQLYKDRYQEAWLPFQNAALAVTNFYKECLNRLQHCVELGQQTGRYCRTKDLVAWARKKRRHIRREDLLAYLSGRPLPPKNRYSSQSGRRLSLERNLPVSRHAHGLSHHSLSGSDTLDGDLNRFQEALTLQGISGTMSSRNTGFHGASGQPVESLEEFALYRDHRKRSTQPHDSIHDSPARKRSRFL